MNKYSLSALLAAGLLAGAATSASAADLGGNCCADLEERIAELEATTARKGNRKVSLTISGWVAEQVTYWDDGVESNAYVSGIGYTLRSNFKFNGEATIRPGLKAGYLMHIEVNTVDPTTTTQKNDDGGSSNTLSVLQSYWYLKDNTLGQISVGQMSHASDNAAILVDGSGSLVPANWVHFDALSFGLRRNGGATFGAWANLATCGHISAGFAGDCNGAPANAVRYDSPTLGGFSVSASWGEDDFWDVTGRYAGEFSGIKIAAAVSWSQNNDESLLGSSSGTPPVTFLSRRDSGYFQAGLYVQHVPTGLFAYGAYGKEFNDNVYTNAGVAGQGALRTAGQPDGEKYYVKAGIRQKWSPLGATVLYGEYSNDHNFFDPTLMTAANVVTGSNFNQWGVGLVQEIDAAAMSIWLSYRNMDGEFTCSTAACLGGVAAGGKTDLDTLHIVKFGALISF